MYGEGNAYAFEFRIHDPRIGRFLSVDPLTKSYPWFTPYQFAANKPIQAIDVDGLENADITGNQITITGVRVAYTCATFDVLGYNIVGGNIPSNFDIQKLYDTQYQRVNQDLKSVPYNLEVFKEATGKLDFISTTSGNTSQYFVQFNIKVIVVNSTAEFNNNPEIQAALKDGSFMGLVSYGIPEVNGQPFAQPFTIDHPAKNIRDDIPTGGTLGMTMLNPNYFQPGSETDKILGESIFHEDGHEVGLDHFGRTGKMATDPMYLEFPGQPPGYNSAGWMKYHGAPGPSRPYPIQIKNALESIDTSVK